MAFSDIPVRQNGQTIIAGWFNTIRTAILDFSGTESISQTSFATATSQTNTVVTGLIFDKTITESVTVDYTIKTATLFEKGSFTLIWDGTVWAIYGGSLSGDNSGVTFDVNTTTGQIDYTSGAETSTIKYKARTFNI